MRSRSCPDGHIRSDNVSASRSRKTPGKSPKRQSLYASAHGDSRESNAHTKCKGQALLSNAHKEHARRQS
eukprot:9151662-Alexandrium_andersonii.AAC.1